MACHYCLMGREGKVEQREQASQGMQAEALSLKAELHRLAEAMQSQADRQVTDAAEEKQALARHQARLDTLQVCTMLLASPRHSVSWHLLLSYHCTIIPSCEHIAYTYIITH